MTHDTTTQPPVHDQTPQAPPPPPPPTAPGQPAPDNPTVVQHNRDEIASLGQQYAQSHDPSSTPIIPGMTPEQDATARALMDKYQQAQTALANLGPSPDPVAQGKAIADLNHARYLIGQFASDNVPPPPNSTPTMRAWTEDDERRQADAEATARYNEQHSALYEGWNAVLAPIGIEIANPYAPVEPYDASRQHTVEKEFSGPPNAGRAGVRINVLQRPVPTAP